MTSTFIWHRWSIQRAAMTNGYHFSQTVNKAVKRQSSVSKEVKKLNGKWEVNCFISDYNVESEKLNSFKHSTHKVKMIMTSNRPQRKQWKIWKHSSPHNSSANTRTDWVICTDWFREAVGGWGRRWTTPTQNFYNFFDPTPIHWGHWVAMELQAKHHLQQLFTCTL